MTGLKEIVKAQKILHEAQKELMEKARDYAAFRHSMYYLRNDIDIDRPVDREGWKYFKESGSRGDIEVFAEKEGEEYFTVSSKAQGSKEFTMEVPWAVVEDFQGWTEAFTAERKKVLEIIDKQRHAITEKKEAEKEAEERALYLRLKEKYEKKAG